MPGIRSDGDIYWEICPAMLSKYSTWLCQIFPKHTCVKSLVENRCLRTVFGFTVEMSPFRFSWSYIDQFVIVLLVQTGTSASYIHNEGCKGWDEIIHKLRVDSIEKWWNIWLICSRTLNLKVLLVQLHTKVELFTDYQFWRGFNEPSTWIIVQASNSKFSDWISWSSFGRKLSKQHVIFLNPCHGIQRETQSARVRLFRGWHKERCDWVGEEHLTTPNCPNSCRVNKMSVRFRLFRLLSNWHGGCISSSKD